METSVKPWKSSQLIKQESKGFHFLSRLVKVTEEDKVEKPKRTRNWKGRKAAERAKRQLACPKPEVGQRPHQKAGADSGDSGCLDSSIVNNEESIADLLTSLDCLPDIDYQTSMPFVNYFGGFSSMQSSEAQTTGKVYSRKNRDRPNSCFDLLQQKIKEARELTMEESKLLEKIEKLLRKPEKSKK